MNDWRDVNRRMNLKHDIYFALTLQQKRKLNKVSSCAYLYELSMENFKKITKNKELIEKFIQLKKCM